MDKRDGIGLTIPLSPVKTMTAPCKQMQANEIATWPALFMSASAASADTRLRRAVSPFSPSTYCTSMPQGFTPPSARLASRPHAFATNRHE